MADGQHFDKFEDNKPAPPADATAAFHKELQPEVPQKAADNTAVTGADKVAANQPLDVSKEGDKVKARFDEGPEKGLATFDQQASEHLSRLNRDDEGKAHLAHMVAENAAFYASRNPALSETIKGWGH